MKKYKKLIVLTMLALLVLAYLYRFTPRRLEFLGHYNKVYAHRVNSLEKQKEALNYFNGIEFDLVFNAETNSLDVNHPPAESIGLTFETYVNQIEVGKYPFLWIDIKKLDLTNVDAIFHKINTVFEAKKYPKNKILIETRSPEALPEFTTAGYKTSYYLQPKLYKKSANDLKKELEYIHSVLALQPEIGISSSYEDYLILKAHFPKKTKYIWALTSVFRPQLKKVNPILNDTTVAIVLTHFKAFSGNR